VGAFDPSSHLEGAKSSLTILYGHEESSPISRQKLLDLANKKSNDRRRAHKALSTIGSLKTEKMAGTGSPTVQVRSRKIGSSGVWSITPYSGILYT
jgi:hypothetical protein